MTSLWRLALTATLAVLAMPAPLFAASALDVAQAAHTTWDGAGGLAVWGTGVAIAGDVNGDGHVDYLVGKGDQLTEPEAGEVRVIFGTAERGRVPIGSTNGFLISGEDQDQASRVAGVGDVNGDGLDDVLVGAPFAYRAGRAGTAYVVFGKADEEAVSLGHFNLGIQMDAGFRIDGAGGHFGEDVSDVGDVNGDGLDDLLISAPFRGAAYVVYGKASTTPVDVRPIEEGVAPTAGFALAVSSVSHLDDFAVSGVGDVNGDGTPDIGVGVVAKNGSPGTAHIVFGDAFQEPVDLRDEELDGLKMVGVFGGSMTGHAISGVGDMNRDGLADLAVSAPASLCACVGKVYVIWGRRSMQQIPLRHFSPKDGFRIIGRTPRRTRFSEQTGTSLAGGSDVNDDGVPDMVVSAPEAYPLKRKSAGVVYVIFGRPNGGRVELDKLGENGLRFIGAEGRSSFSTCDTGCIGDALGGSVDMAPTEDGDGAYVLLGAVTAGFSDEGQTYLIKF
jgi:hypothetical protein